jgi:hypothetical protein
MVPMVQRYHYHIVIGGKVAESTYVPNKSEPTVKAKVQQNVRNSVPSGCLWKCLWWMSVRAVCCKSSLQQLRGWADIAMFSKSVNFTQALYALWKIMVVFQVVRSPDRQTAWQWMLLYLHIPPLSLWAAASKTMNHHISQGMLQKFFVLHFLDDGLAGMVQFCGHLGALIGHAIA